MAETKSEEAVRLRSKASGMLKSSGQALIQDLWSPSSRALPASKEPKSSYFLTESLAEMANEDPIRLQNQSGVIREEIARIMGVEYLVYSSLGRLPTFSIGLSSTRRQSLPPAPLRERRVDLKEKYSRRYFQMPELGAKIFVGDVDGCDTITCRMVDYPYRISEFDLDSENAAVSAFYEDDRPGGLSSRLRGLQEKFGGSEDYFDVILSGTELVVASPKRWRVLTVVGNLRRKGSSVFGFSSDFKDSIYDKTVRKASDTVQQPRDLVPCVAHGWPDNWRSFEGAFLLRSTQGSYLKKPKFMKEKLGCSKYRDVLQLTRFDDFVVLGNITVYSELPSSILLDIVRKNASQTADVIAAQLVKSVVEFSGASPQCPITFVVILLNHKEILLREEKKKENVAQKYNARFLGFLGLKGILQSTMLKDDKKFTELMDEEKITFKNFPPEMEDIKGVKIEEDYKEKILVGESLPNIPQISPISLQENEARVKSAPISSNLPSARMQDDSEASSSTALIEDDCKSKDLKVSHHITKWNIYGDFPKRTLLCFFNVEDMKFEFYFEDHESMGAIIGLGVPHSKVILECSSPHLTVVEIPQEDWDVAWTHSNIIPCSFREGNTLKEESFPNILHRIAHVINIDNIVNKANNDGNGGDNGEDQAPGNVDDGKGKGKYEDHNGEGNIGHQNGSSDGAPDNNEKNGRKGKDENDDENDDHDGADRKASNDDKEIQAIVHLRFCPGGIPEEKGKGKGLGEVHEEVVEGKKEELEEIHEEETEAKKEEFEGVRGVVAKKKKKGFVALWCAFKRSQKCNIGRSQQTTKEIENGDVDAKLLKQLENQIHAEMVFIFTIKREAGGPLKTIQATIRHIEFQFQEDNEENYLLKKRFGWFHEKMQVGFGVVNKEVADLDAKSRKALDYSEVEESITWGNSKENASSSSNAFKGRAGGTVVGATGFVEYTRMNGSEAKTTEEFHNSLKTTRSVTRGDFYIIDRTNLGSQELKYLYLPRFPFKEEEFEELHDDDRLKMYNLNPICQSQQVSCEGTWHPCNSEKLVAYKLEASRELRMTRIYNLELETTKKKKRNEVQKVKKNLPLCYTQKLEKVVYLNHAMSHLTSTSTGVYRLKERDVLNNPSTSFSQGQEIEIQNKLVKILL